MKCIKESNGRGDLLSKRGRTTKVQLMNVDEHQRETKKKKKQSTTNKLRLVGYAEQNITRGRRHSVCN